jgi:hypothetical protein
MSQVFCQVERKGICEYHIGILGEGEGKGEEERGLSRATSVWKKGNSEDFEEVN